MENILNFIVANWWWLTIIAIVAIGAAMVFTLPRVLFGALLWIGGILLFLVVISWFAGFIKPVDAAKPVFNVANCEPRNSADRSLDFGASLLAEKCVYQDVTNPAVPPTQVVPPTQAVPPAGGNVPTDNSAPHMDKIGTFAEIDGAGSQRIEAGGGGWQHVDFYPARGTKAISYILPPMEPMVWHGFGSIWQCVGNCTADWMKADATGYAGGNAMPNNTANHDNGRLDQGHSGLVYIWNNGTWQLVANVANLSQSQIDELMSMHQQGMTTPSSTNTNTNPTPNTATTTTGTVPGCPAATSKDYTSATNVTVQGPAIVQPWWSKTQYRALVQQGQTVTFNGMKGKVYSYENNAPCVTNLPSEFNNSSFPVITITGPTVSEPAK